MLHFLANKPLPRLFSLLRYVPQKLAAQLGLESVEELEAAIDALEGIAPDGGVMEGDPLAREARVRSAYMDWCKEYGKEVDEKRFQQFSSNFLVMEEYAKESGKEMSLNEYADCTEEEYAAILSGEEPAKVEVKVEVETEDTTDVEDAAAAAAAKAEADKEAAAKAEAAAAKKAEEDAAAAKAAEVAAAKQAKEDAVAKKKSEAEKKEAAAEAEKQKALAEKGMYRFCAFVSKSFCRG